MFINLLLVRIEVHGKTTWVELGTRRNWLEVSFERPHYKHSQYGLLVGLRRKVNRRVTTKMLLTKYF